MVRVHGGRIRKALGIVGADRAGTPCSGTSAVGLQIPEPPGGSLRHRDGKRVRRVGEPPGYSRSTTEPASTLMRSLGLRSGIDSGQSATLPRAMRTGWAFLVK